MLKNNQHFHFIGICGIGMSGIAKILLTQNIKVSGCDKNIDPQRTKELLNLGCTIDIHQSNICNDPSITTIVRTSDVQLNHPEIMQAQSKNIPILLRAEILAKIMHEKISIAVAGAHGKTTTSSLLAHVLLHAKIDPTMIVGGHMHELNSNAHAGSGKYLVAESDESDRSFLLLPKNYTIVTNVDREHLNTYQDFDDIKNAFIQFINNIPSDGCNFICIDDAGIQSIQDRITTPYLTYGTSTSANFHIQNVQLSPDFSEFELKIQNVDLIMQHITSNNLGIFKVALPGMHNVLNATGVIAVCLRLGLDEQAIKNGLESFQGVDRRFTFKGVSKNHGAMIFDDYGHHPREIEVTFKVAQAKTNGKIIVVFQPQRFSRTKHLWNEFVQTLAFAPIDQLILTDIYSANEASIDGVTSQNLVAEIQKMNPALNVNFIAFGNNGEQILSKLNESLSKDDLLLFQGAGKVNQLADKLI
ncbi:UDP-N-acetylmuramate--L-alanine ligase [Candidatus Babeliales bacterium]|nr:UDP-N-acetylmuramate--L-alanine ligase [Candidatus Babeliales bacterium]